MYLLQTTRRKIVEMFIFNEHIHRNILFVYKKLKTFDIINVE